jgi:hypothetical protein
LEINEAYTFCYKKRILEYKGVSSPLSLALSSPEYPDDYISYIGANRP